MRTVERLRQSWPGRVRQGGLNCSAGRPARPCLFGIVGCILVLLHRWVGLDESHQFLPIGEIVLL
jgi:hypothetical protein